MFCDFRWRICIIILFSAVFVNVFLELTEKDWHDELNDKTSLTSYLYTEDIKKQVRIHCAKNVQIRSFFWSVFSHIQTGYGKTRTRKNSIFGQFLLSDYINDLLLFLHIYSSNLNKNVGNGLSFQDQGHVLLLVCYFIYINEYCQDLTRPRKYYF